MTVKFESKKLQILFKVKQVGQTFAYMYSENNTISCLNKGELKPAGFTVKQDMMCTGLYNLSRWLPDHIDHSAAVKFMTSIAEILVQSVIYVAVFCHGLCDMACAKCINRITCSVFLDCMSANKINVSFLAIDFNDFTNTPTISLYPWPLSGF